jgi:hypothetical protein
MIGVVYNKSRAAQRALIWVISLVWSPAAFACATCFGQSDSPLAAGMNYGIMTMIVVAYSVLFSIIGFFIFVARKAAATAKLEAETAELSAAAVEEIHNNELCSKNS